MDQGNSDHGAHGEQHIHLPDPSIWPLVVGAAALFLGLALVWWSQDRDSNISGPALGAAAVFTLISAAGWATEDARMRRKADLGESSNPRNARYTQVITFAIEEGHLAAARQSGGLLAQLESADERVRNLAGYQDLRIITTPTATGPAQVLVETTWSDREGLASYEESRRTLLDLINGREDVVPGSLQVFDMEVVRDTKDVAFRFGLGSTFALLGGLVVAGFMVGAGLTLFQEESVAGAGGGGETPAPADPLKPEVIARDNSFQPTTLTAPANTEITVTLTNRGRAKHNIHFLTAQGGQTLPGAKGEIIDGGTSEALTFTTPGPGSYFYYCDVHPSQMTGTLIVQ
jgi:plastocyanin/heme-degrading monooxygenase HmoA